MIVRAKIQVDPQKDLRNHGDSPHDPVHTYSSMADDVDQFMDDHGIKHPVLIGHSMFVYIICTAYLARLSDMQGC